MFLIFKKKGLMNANQKLDSEIKRHPGVTPKNLKGERVCFFKQGPKTLSNLEAR